MKLFYLSFPQGSTIPEELGGYQKGSATTTSAAWSSGCGPRSNARLGGATTGIAWPKQQIVLPFSC